MREDGRTQPNQRRPERRVCLTVQARDAITGAHHGARATVVDRLVGPTAELVNLTDRLDVREVAKTRALEKLASRHAQEFRTVFREELAAAKLIEELDLLDP